MNKTPENGTTEIICETTAESRPENDGAAGFLRLAAEALASGDAPFALKYADKAIAVNDRCSRAWALRAAAAAAGGADPEHRAQDAVNAWITAAKACGDVGQNGLSAEIDAAYSALFFDEIRSAAQRFAEEPVSRNADLVLRTVSLCLKNLNLLTAQANVVFNVGPLFTRTARILSDTAARVYRIRAGAFGPRHNNMMRWQWETYTEAGDCCLRLLDTAVRLCRDTDLGKRICDTYLQIAERVMNSCSWRYTTESGREDPYEPDLAFTSEAKSVRAEEIRRFRAIRGYFEADQPQRISADLAAERKEADASRGRDAYWAANRDEAERLRAESAALQAAAEEAAAQMETLPVSAEIAKAEASLSEIRTKASLLGIGKRKQKQELALQALALQTEISELQTEEANQKKALSWTIKKANARMAEIRRIFAAPRGSLPAPAGSFTLQREENGTGLGVTPQRLSEQLSALLRERFGELRLTDVREAETTPPEDYAFPEPCWLLEPETTETEPGQNQTALRFYLFAKSRTESVSAILLESPAAFGADEANLHDFAPVAAAVLLSLLRGPDLAEAERIALSLRHGGNQTVYQSEGLCCFYACCEAPDADGGVQYHDLLVFRPGSGTGASDFIKGE